MATQFEVLLEKLNEILDNQATIMGLITTEMESEFRLDAEVPDETLTRPRNMNRREVEVSGFDGTPKMVKWVDIDPRIVKAIELSTELNHDYQLYEDPSGMVRISVDAEVEHILRKANTVQESRPFTNEDIDAFGIDA